MRLTLVGWLLLSLAAVAAAPATADSAGSADISTSFSAFSSPSNAYGPWVSENLDLQLPPDRRTGIHIENRRASDLYNPNTEFSVSLDRYQPLTRTVAFYASAGFGSGAPFPQDRFYAELDAKAAKSIVLFAGGALGSGYGIGATQQLTAGAYYYFGDDYISVRYAPAWSRTLGNVRGYQAALALGHPGRTTETFRLGSGGENDISLISPINPTIIGEREFGAGASIKHWTSTTSGYHLDLSYGMLGRTGGSRIYSRTSVGVGWFFALR